jgi:carboxyl-terminal processing protease
MIRKKTAVTLIAVISATLCLITFLITFFAVKNAPDEKGQLYVTAEQYKTLAKYSLAEKVEDIIKQSFYKDTDEDTLVNGALKGMVASLQDPYSNYYTKEEYKSYNDKLGGKYTGIGIVIKIDPTDGLPQATKIFEDSPAAEAGIAVGDKLLSANGEKLSGLDTEAVADKITGPEGTKVTVSFLHDGKEFTKEIERRKVEMDMVSYNMQNDDIGEIIISQFNGNCVDGFKQAMAALKKENAKGVIVDLRDNPGGLLKDVCDILDLILPQGTLVYTENKAGKKETYESDANYWNIPMVVLVNGNSASASEVFAGAVQDYGRAKLIGVKTFGKGIVQTIVPIKETGSAVKLTTSRYFTPKGRNIHGTGIVPDYVVELSLQAGQELTAETDTQLKKALEVIGGMAK